MSDWVKINNDIYHIKDCVVQLSVMAHATINIEIDLKKYPTYSDVFFNMYDNKTEKIRLDLENQIKSQINYSLQTILEKVNNSLK